MAIALEMEDLNKDPGKYGYCDFETFRKNPAKWRPDPEQLFKSVEEAGSEFKPYIKKMKFEIEGYACDTLEKVQDICRAMGYREKDLTIRPFIDPLGGGMMNLVVRFFHNDTIKKRGMW